MIIEANDEIKRYLKRLKANLKANYQNDYLDGYITPNKEKEAKRELMLAGQQEFLDKKSPSLFINSKEWAKNPYFTNVKFNNIKNKHFAYKTITIDKGYLFNADDIQDDKDHELKDWMKLRALDEDIKALFLYQDDKEWMMSVPSETLTNDPYAYKARGNVVTFGLGIGYFVYMAMLNDKVTKVTVIEKSKEVIKLFEEIKKYFPDKPLEIIEGDAFDYFNQSFLKSFDYIYVDIWQSSEDGRSIITKLLEQYLPPLRKCDFWIENSCLAVIRTLIYLHYDELVYNRKNNVKAEYKHLMHKVRCYFSKIHKTIKDVDTLKSYMYSKEVLREIASLK